MAPPESRVTALEFAEGAQVSQEIVDFFTRDIIDKIRKDYTETTKWLLKTSKFDLVLDVQAAAAAAHHLWRERGWNERLRRFESGDLTLQRLQLVLRELPFESLRLCDFR